MSQQPQPTLPHSASAGRMTAAMRAAPVTGPKVLRIGVVQGGRVIDERIIRPRADVTVGSNERNTFVVGAPSVGRGFKLFELHGGGYHLNFNDRIDGRIALRTGIQELGALRQRAERGAHGGYRVQLTDDARGKIIIGDTTLLFQFVAPPPAPPRAQLPVAVLEGATRIDWRTTIIAAVSFLFHFSVIGALYSDWMDPVQDYELDVSALVENVKSLPPPPPVEQPKETEKPTETDKPEEEAKPKAEKTSTSQKGPMTAARAAALTNELQQLEMSLVGALAGLGPATQNVLQGGELPTGLLDQAANSAAGVGAGGIGLSLGNGGGTIRPGEAGGGLSSIGNTGTSGGSDTGKAAKVKGPTGNASVGGAAVSGGQVSNASRVVAAMRAGFRRCYTRGLATNPDSQGRINLSIKVGPGGEVAGVSASASGNLPPDVIACVQARARASRFDPPQGGMAVIQVPVTFVKQ